MNINEITQGMTPQEKEIYFSHMEKRHREEQEKIEAEKLRLCEYKKTLIKDIMDLTNNYTYAQLKTKPIRSLEEDEKHEENYNLAVKYCNNYHDVEPAVL